VTHGWLQAAGVDEAKLSNPLETTEVASPTEYLGVALTLLAAPALGQTASAEASKSGFVRIMLLATVSPA